MCFLHRDSRALDSDSRLTEVPFDHDEPTYEGFDAIQAAADEDAMEAFAAQVDWEMAA